MLKEAVRHLESGPQCNPPHIVNSRKLRHPARQLGEGEKAGVQSPGAGLESPLDADALERIEDGVCALVEEALSWEPSERISPANQRTGPVPRSLSSYTLRIPIHYLSARSQ